MTFEEANRLFRDNQILALAADPDGLRYLYIRSLCRKEHLLQLFSAAHVPPSPTVSRELFREAFNTRIITLELIRRVIRQIFEASRRSRRHDEETLINNLYRLDVFDWGGLHQNSLEKTIVNNYVKKIKEYDAICDKIDNDLHMSLRGYVLNSWYNHWTSIIIEDTFRDHDKVLPSVGLVKKIDFFINNTPFDLKVTYFPEGFVKDQRRNTGRKSELTLLKRSARTNNIAINRELPEARLLQDMWMKHNDHPKARDIIDDLREFRLQLLRECRENPVALIKWLYENQGERRFDASNRIFLVLYDRMNFFDSWKLKRA